jgi:hypothetical protein
MVTCYGDTIASGAGSATAASHRRHTRASIGVAPLARRRKFQASR